ncbi:MAG: TIGR02206 family membrane protein [Rhodothermales bacterium]|nr:TIGR02206 family membrane protein [Rhodothermales bacterium]MBO6778639.1 TIGR02206 family membrane protein [Rhodothermales bacterium]
MERYFDVNWTGPAFDLFGPAHLTIVGLFALLATAMIVAGRRGPAERKDLIRRTFGALMLLNEAGTHVWKVSYGTWAVEESLPLQLCGAMAWISGSTLLFGWKKLWPMLYFFGVGGAVQGVITPNATQYGFPHYQMIETIFAHSALVVAGLWVVLVEGYRPTLRQFFTIFLGLNVAALVMYFVNLGLGSNYLFVNAKPPDASIIDAMPEWPYYIPILEVIAFVQFGVLYLPFARRGTGEVPAPARSGVRS